METLFVLTAVCLNSLFVWPDETNGNYNVYSDKLSGSVLFSFVVVQLFRFMLPPLELFTVFS